MPENGADSESAEASAAEVFAAAEHSSEFFFANDKKVIFISDLGS